ncbi:MAG: alpha/beta hydrolase [Janthinobacterium lividum]
MIAIAGLVFAAASGARQPARAEPRACIGIGDKAAPQPVRLWGYRPVPYRKAAERALLLHVLPAKNVPPGRKAPAILLFFGGGWLYGSIGQFDPQARALADLGITAILVDYRVLCRDGVDPRAGMGDAAAAMRFVRAHADELSIDPHRVAAGGGSAGGQLALSTAFDTDPAVRPDALVLFNPVVDLADGDLAGHFATLSSSDIRSVSPVTHEAATYPPMLIMHGIDDRLVPIGQVEAFCNAVSAYGRSCTLLAYPDAGHGFFNPGVAGGRWFAATLAATENFLSGRLIGGRG